jgi:hypothetical protein
MKEEKKVQEKFTEDFFATTEQWQLMIDHFNLSDEFMFNDDGKTILAKTIDGWVKIEPYRKPTPKKEYKYTPPKVNDLMGIDKDGNEVRWTEEDINNIGRNKNNKELKNDAE